jgi:hypothetical protein
MAKRNQSSNPSPSYEDAFNMVEGQELSSSTAYNPSSTAYNPRLNSPPPRNLPGKPEVEKLLSYNNRKKVPGVPPEDFLPPCEIFTTEIPQLSAEELFVQCEEDNETSKDVIPQETVEAIIATYANKCNCTVGVALSAIINLIQWGGTNATQKNRKRKINGIVFDIEVLRSVIQFHDKNATVRKLAKSIRDTVAYISIINSWPVPLVKDLKRLEPQLDINDNDAIYCNEIHVDNYSKHVPAKIREALQRRERNIREKNIQPAKKKNKKRKRGK